MADQNLVVEVDCSTGIATTRSMTQEELDARAASVAQAQAEADAQTQVDAQKASEVAFQTQLAATNAKLMALGLTATDIETLLNAAKN